MRCIALAALSPAFHNPSTMNINSRLFDSIRIGASEAEAPVESDAPRCSHPGCARTGEFRAPKGRGREGQFFVHDGLELDRRQSTQADLSTSPVVGPLNPSHDRDA